MNKFHTPLIVVLAIAATTGVFGWKTQSSKHSAAVNDLAVTSNRLAEATAKLAEQGAAVSTLRVQLDLQRADLVAVTNLLAEMSAHNAAQSRARREAEASCEKQAAELRAAKTASEKDAALLTALETTAAGMRGELESLQLQATAAQSLVRSTVTALNASENARAELLRQWSDPSALRAGLVEAERKAGRRPASPGEIVLQPDGSVAVLAPSQSSGSESRR
jgi:phage terminase Nu1 subunit (DNA packaging protein)